MVLVSLKKVINITSINGKKYLFIEISLHDIFLHLQQEEQQEEQQKQHLLFFIY